MDSFNNISTKAILRFRILKRLYGKFTKRWYNETVAQYRSDFDKFAAVGTWQQVTSFGLTAILVVRDRHPRKSELEQT